jgi:transcriptional regulator with XRE-family HTH domain
MLDQFAEELKTAREKSGITLQQMAAKTRIDIKFLEAIDQGNFSFLPELYVKAFLKEYAKTIGIDENETAKKYEAAKLGIPPSEAEEHKIVHVEKDAESHQPANTQTPEPPVKTYVDPNISQQKPGTGQDPQTKMIMAVSILAVAALAIILYLTVFQKSSDIIVEEKPFDQVIQDSQPRFSEGKNNQKEIIPPVVADSLLLKFTNVDSTDTSWIYVILDQKTAEEFLLYPHRTRSLKAASNFEFTLGNSGVVSLQLDDKNLPFDGRRKSVRYYKVDTSGIQKLSSPPSLKQN